MRHCKDHHLSLIKTAEHFVMDVWLVLVSVLKLLHVEIVSFELKQL